MIRIGGQAHGNLPPHDPELERRLANWAVLGNVGIFTIVVAAINAAPYVMQQLGFESALV